MARTKKEHDCVTIKMDKQVSERLRKYCEHAGQTKTIAIERAVVAYIEQYEAKAGIRIESSNEE